MDYQIAIPSYQRPDRIKECSLKTLKKLDAKMSNVTVFVANDEQYKIYKKALSNVNIVVGELGIGKQRIFINNYYDKDTKIFCLDDDIISLAQKNGDKLIEYDSSLDQIVEKGYSICEKINARMWAVNPVYNGFFMSDTISIGLRYIIGAFFGSYGKCPVWGEGRKDFSSGEDYLSSILSYNLYGSVVRFDGICIKTKYFAEGGIQGLLGGKEKRYEDHKQKLTWIEQTYPDLAKVYYKSGNVPNLRLKRVTHKKVRFKV